MDTVDATEMGGRGELNRILTGRRVGQEVAKIAVGVSGLVMNGSG